jgi:DeoR/GlpR family transcriptional regulator of sugar metabolism
VLVKLTLPVAADSGNKNYNVECKGVVVRSEDESSGGFNIAVFFNEINGEEKKKISEYVAQFLPKGACVLNRG